MRDEGGRARLLVNEAGEADADTLDGAAAPAYELARALDDARRRLAHVGVGRELFLFEDAPGEVAGGDDRRDGAEVYADGDRVGRAEREQDGRAAAARLARDLLDKPAALQLVYDEQDGRALERRLLRYLGARDGAALAHVVEHNLAVDVANRVGARDAGFFEVDSAHCVGRREGGGRPPCVRRTTRQGCAIAYKWSVGESPATFIK
jgi:hypothetical protein